MNDWKNEPKNWGKTETVRSRWNPEWSERKNTQAEKAGPCVTVEPTSEAKFVNHEVQKLTELVLFARSGVTVDDFRAAARGETGGAWGREVQRWAQAMRRRGVAAQRITDMVARIIVRRDDATREATWHFLNGLDAEATSDE